ncbi:MAG: FAD-dependent hydroxylase [Woronichinia naegeliana WA131]|jgi:2-octaprenyl-6-methoxyphenol hydroxylase|uniref:FAD-dependent hydroxylase n=1 Tax=Woronichinia naegeliana WA131 TaxID=2824559 RepID=A0A977KRU9_9CYAN|nr:MAG: FAD-dependent hydroxylase [Woronichinia naegeliana WA131]
MLDENANLSESLTFDLAIVGGGIVGATLASILKTTGLKIALIESLPPEQALFKPQAYALSLFSSRIFKGIGIWSQILPKIGKFAHIRLSDADYAGIVPFAKTDLQTEDLGYVGEHQIILAALQDNLPPSSHLQWIRPAEVIAVDYQPEQVVLTIKQNQTESKIQAKLVIGADGAKSRLRSLAGIQTKGWKYWQSCVAFTIHHQAPRNDIAFERFWYSGPMGVLPLPDNRCQIVWTLPHAQAQALTATDEADFLQQLQTRLAGSLGPISLVSPRRLFPVQLMQSDRYIQPRLALVGDAAHCCHPVGGQGLNMGIRDAAALAEVIQTAFEQGEDFGSLGVLKRYERWRKPENLIILGFTDLLDRLFSNDWLLIVLIRRLGLGILAQFAPVKILALKLMTGLLGRQPRLAQPYTKFLNT